MDGLYPLGWGEKQPVAIGYLDEANPQAVRRFLEPLVQRLGVSVIVTDDLSSFRTVANKLGLEHQVCQFHPSTSSGQVVRRWVGRAIRELSSSIPIDWLWVLDEIKGLLAELPPEGSRRLFEFWKQIPERRTGQAGERSPLELLRNLLIRLNEHWDSYRVFDWQTDAPWTNNRTDTGQHLT